VPISVTVFQEMLHQPWCCSFGLGISPGQADLMWVSTSLEWKD